MFYEGTRRSWSQLLEEKIRALEIPSLCRHELPGRASRVRSIGQGPGECMNWDDRRWAERRDSPWKASRRWLQSWWREIELGLPAGPPTDPRRKRPVASMLPQDVGWDANYLSETAAAVARGLLDTHVGGIVDDDRLRRNLLSSQPLCVNLFGHLAEHPGVLVQWLQQVGFNAAEIVDVRFEWAPPREQHFGGGSAFDTMVVYRTGSDRLGFVGIETKYAENLAEQSVTKRPVYAEYTEACGHWRDGAVGRLKQPVTVQLWLNTLLAQSTVELHDEDFDEGRCLMMSCAADHAALDATVDVAAELEPEESWLDWVSYEELIDIAARHEDTAAWAERFRRRYLDPNPINHLVDAAKNRLSTGDRAAVEQLASAARLAAAVAERVCGEDSIIDQAVSEPGRVRTVDALVAARRLEQAIGSMKQARIVAGREWRQ